MLDLSSDQRRLLLDKVPDIANLVAAGLVFGQLLAPASFSMPIAVFGGSLWIALFGWMMFIARKRR